MIEMILPDGSKRQLENPMTVVEFAKSIGSSLGKATVGAIIDGVQVDPSHIIDKSGTIEIITNTSEKGIEIIRHSAAHIMAQAVQRLFPNTKVTIGPVIENGFFYDFDPEKPFTEEDLAKIEEEMAKIVKENYEFKRSEMTAEDAKKMFAEMGEDYKIEIIDDLGVDKVSIYQQGEFVDLCRGTHIPSTGYLKAFKLMSTAGAYWRGNENNPQLTRVYGTSFPKQKDLTEYLTLLEEAKKRDHRKIGKEMELFMFSDRVGKGLPIWLPKGTQLRLRLQELLRRLLRPYNYQEVITPGIGGKNLYVTSGHYAHYGKDAFQPIHTPEEDEEYMLKPMNCPHHCEIYAYKPRSYKDLPLRIAEFGTVFRYEKSGELHGLTRVRTFTQDDAHIFVRPDQVKAEFENNIDIILKVFKTFGFDNYEAQISLRDPEDKEKYIGSDEVWEESEAAIKEACAEKGLNARVELGEAAFYGPKLDFMVKDAIGRRWQLGTIQVDYNLPNRFKLEYTAEDNSKKTPVMVHRAPFGSLERFTAVLIEHTAGHFPLWLTPDQVAILPISEKYNDYAQKVKAYFDAHDVRSIMDDRNEKIGRKIRDNELKRVPYMVIVGEKEAAEGLVSMRQQGGGEQATMTMEAFAERINNEVAEQLKGLD
mgnify:CR=1 FL=1